jgi:hypothetical protein
MTGADATRLTRLTAARMLVGHGPTARIIDRNATQSTFSRAVAAHARTFEVPAAKAQYR